MASREFASAIEPVHTSIKRSHPRDDSISLGRMIVAPVLTPSLVRIVICPTWTPTYLTQHLQGRVEQTWDIENRILLPAARPT